MCHLRPTRAVLGVLMAGLFFLQSPAVRAADTNAWPIAATAATPSSSLQPVDEPIVKPFDIVADNREIAQAQGASAHPRSFPLWPLGLDYTIDASFAWAFGVTGSPSGSNGLPGGMDVIGRWGFSRNSRLVVGYYDLQEYPVGFSTGTVPVYLQGVAAPIATANLSINNATVQNHLIITHWDQILWTQLMGQPFPVIISPTYTHRWGSIGGGTDYLPVEINGFPYYDHYRTGDFLALGLTFPVPILTQPKYHLLTTYTIGPQWAAPATGANQSNTAQLVQILHLQWHPRPQIQIDLAPSLYPNLLPTDQWPQHYLTMIYSAAYTFGKPSPLSYGYSPFVQATVSMGGAINVAPYGITGLYCQALPCTSPSSLVPSLGGNHAAQIQLKLGIGRPDIIPL